MTWRVIEPNGLGDYFPKGQPVGWKETIEDYYNTQMTDIEQKELGMEARVSFLEFSEKFTKDLGPLEEYAQPRKFEIPRTHKKTRFFDHDEKRARHR